MGAIALAGAFNVRDVGGLATADGHVIRPGLLYRGDSLDAITVADADLLFRQLRIGAVIDLRTAAEVAPAAWRDSGPAYHRFPLISEKKMGTEPFPDGVPSELGKIYLSDARDGMDAVRDTFTALAAHLRAGTACVVHCAAGRDRTGVIFGVLLSLLGVPGEVIAQDYAASNRNADQVALRLAENPLYANGAKHPGAVAMPEAMAAFLALLRDAYGGTAGYAARAGITPETIGQLRAALVGGAPSVTPAAAAGVS